MTATTAVQADHRGLLLQAYAAYNSQDVEALVALASDDLNWPDDDAGSCTARTTYGLTGRSRGPHEHRRPSR